MFSEAMRISAGAPGQQSNIVQTTRNHEEFEELRITGRTIRIVAETI
jgi:hypothetical protein